MCRQAECGACKIPRFPAGPPGRDPPQLPHSSTDPPALSANILWLHDLRLTALAQVGGKNSSLGEMIGNLSGLGVSVPGGFATTADAFKEFVAYNDLSKRIFARLATLDVEDVDALVAAGKQIRGWVIEAPLQPALEAAIREAYAKLCAEAGGPDGARG